MQASKVVLIFLSLVIVSCSPQKEDKEAKEFKLPRVINSNVADTVKLIPFEANGVSEVFPKFAGKYRFQDEIDINPTRVDTTLENDIVHSYAAFDTLDVNGFEVIVDYETSVKFEEYYGHESPLAPNEYFPVYFVNSTNSNKLFLGKDGYVFGIQEAFFEDEKYRGWQPIEARGFDFCGNGHWGLIIRPQEFAVVLMRKYTGDYETGLRVRLVLDESTIVSKPFKGRVSKKQYTIPDSSYLEERLQETNGKAAAWLFYGAVPKEEE